MSYREWVEDFEVNEYPIEEIVMAEKLTVEQTLKQRGSRYGDFSDHARICQSVKTAMLCGNWERLSDVQKQALEVIADKIARILSGDPNYDDNWHDIQGYAKLVEDRLPKEETSINNDARKVARHD